MHLQGVTGYEGIFRKSCEVTLRLLREQSDPLMWYVEYFNIAQTISTMALSILKTFIHDPLVEWNRGRVRNESKETVQDN